MRLGSIFSYSFGPPGFLYRGLKPSRVGFGHVDELESKDLKILGWIEGQKHQVGWHGRKTEEGFWTGRSRRSLWRADVALATEGGSQEVFNQSPRSSSIIVDGAVLWDDKVQAQHGLWDLEAEVWWRWKILEACRSRTKGLEIHVGQQCELW